MSQYRKDPLVERWVIMAPERAARPVEVHDEPLVVRAQIDPFAEGSESETTGELLAYRDKGSAANGPGWRVRVIANKYPAVTPSNTLEVHDDDFYQSMPGMGAHEVIIECPHGEANLSRLSPAAVADVVTAYRDRLIDLSNDPRLAHAMIFKNQGATAGASIHHAHSQLIATPFVPVLITNEIAGALAYYRQTGRNIFDAMIEHELAAGSRIVLQTEQFLVVCPFASRFAYEMCILPRQSGSHFERVQAEALRELGSVLHATLRKLDLALDDPAFNMVVHSGPLRESELPHYRWHVEILPRQTRVAGFEWGSGCFMNQVLPEDAATLLRSTEI